MKLEELVLTNFKGIASFTLQPQGQSLNVYADNGVGKTSLFDSVLWLLFNKDSRGQSGFEVKTLTTEGQPVHKLEHSVEATFSDTPMGDQTFKKVFRENWVKKRGSLQEEFDGHECTYFVNGVQMSKRDYDARVASICPDSRFQLISDPGYFPGLDAKARRALLMQTFGGAIDDATIIKYEASLSEVPAIVGREKLEDARRALDDRRKALVKENDGIPGRMDELAKSRETSPAAAGAVLDLAELRSKLAKAERERAEASTGAGRPGLLTDIAKAEEAVERFISGRRREHDEGCDASRQERRRKQGALDEAQQTVERLRRQYDADMAEHGRLTANLERMRAEHKAVMAETFGGATSCPTCEQPLPAERVEAARAQWNESRALDLERRTTAGKAAKAAIEALGASIQGLCDQIKDAERAVESLARQIDDMPADPEFFFEPTADYKALVDKRDRLQKEKADAESGTGKSLGDIDARIDGLRRDIAAAEQQAASAARRQDVDKRLRELEAREKAIAVEHEEVVRKIGLLDEFTRTKVSLMTDRINEQFGMVKFVLFREQINGGIEDCCEITYNGVPWSGMSAGQRINAGLDIVDSMVKVLGADPAPIFIDEAESVTRIRPTAGQQIRLVVSEADKVLRVETDEEARLRRRAAVRAAHAEYLAGMPEGEVEEYLDRWESDPFSDGRVVMGDATVYETQTDNDTQKELALA